MSGFNQYKKRSVRFLELWEWNGWRIKIYGISVNGEVLQDVLIEKARQIARRRLPLPAVENDRYGIGFLVVHEGQDGDFIFVDWWWGQDIVQHHLYGAAKGENQKFKYQDPPGAGFCVWELAVFWFEREAWVKHILKKSEKPDFQSYLEERLNADV